MVTILRMERKTSACYILGRISMSVYLRERERAFPLEMYIYILGLQLHWKEE